MIPTASPRFLRAMYVKYMHWHISVVTGSTHGRRKLRISWQYWPNNLPFVLWLER